MKRLAWILAVVCLFAGVVSAQGNSSLNHLQQGTPYFRRYWGCVKIILAAPSQKTLSGILR